jgi:ankyrin repeat protein
MVRLLLDLGADVDERVTLEELEEPTPSWGYPLWWAATLNHVEIAKLLLDRGADPNANVYASGWPLNRCWDFEDESMKRLLVSRGAKRTPYMISEQHDVDEAARLLRDAERAAADDASQETFEELARELAWSAADHGCPEIVALAVPHLIKRPRDDRYWHWLLMQPIRGAGPNSAENDDYFTCMETLLAHGIDPNARRAGATVLHFAAAYSGPVSDGDRARFAAMLIDWGARLDVRDEVLKSTPLGWACRWGRVKLAELLIARGAKVEEPDAEAWAAPRAWAEKMKRDAVLHLLDRALTI